MKRASEGDYAKFRKYFTFSCVDLLIFRDDSSVLLTKRTINPFKGYWHLPGTIIRRDETRKNAVKRAAKEELGKEITIREELGIYESIVSFRHDISNALLVKLKNKKKTHLEPREYVLHLHVKSAIALGTTLFHIRHRITVEEL